MVVLIVVNAFFVVAEFAIVKGARHPHRRAGGDRQPACPVADHIVSHLAAYLSATQLGVTAASLGLGWLGAVAFSDLLGAALNPTLAAILAFVIITFITIIFGELVPKSLAIRKAGAVDPGHRRPAPLVLRDHPAVHLVPLHHHRGSAQAVPHRARVRERPGPLRGGAAHDPRGQPGGGPHRRGGADPHAAGAHLRRPYGERHHGAPHRDRLPAHSRTVNEAIAEVEETNHTRYPVFEEDVDNIIGYVHVKDLYRAPRRARCAACCGPSASSPRPRTSRVALQRFQSTRTPLAIVVDEHGGTAGIVTIQDVVEELIGEVQDEFDLEAPPVEPQNDGGYSVDGSTRVDYLEEALGMRLPEEGFPTLGGRVFEQLQRRPRVGDEVRVGEFHARVTEVDGMRISRVMLT